MGTETPILLIIRNASSGRVIFFLGSILGTGELVSSKDEDASLYTAQNLIFAITKRLFKTVKITIKVTIKIKKNLFLTTSMIISENKGCVRRLEYRDSNGQDEQS